MCRTATIVFRWIQVDLRSYGLVGEVRKVGDRGRFKGRPLRSAAAGKIPSRRVRVPGSAVRKRFVGSTGGRAKRFLGTADNVGRHFNLPLRELLPCPRATMLRARVIKITRHDRHRRLYDDVVVAVVVVVVVVPGYRGSPASSCRRTGATRPWPAAVATAVAAARSVPVAAATTYVAAAKHTGTKAGPSRPRASTWRRRRHRRRQQRRTISRKRRKSRRPRPGRPTACPWCPYPTQSSCPCSTAVCCRYVSTLPFAITRRSLAAGHLWACACGKNHEFARFRTMCFGWKLAGGGKHNWLEINANSRISIPFAGQEGLARVRIKMFTPQTNLYCENVLTRSFGVCGGRASGASV